MHLPEGSSAILAIMQIVLNRVSANYGRGREKWQEMSQCSVRRTIEESGANLSRGSTGEVQI